jgi:hypothetical protein
MRFYFFGEIAPHTYIQLTICIYIKDLERFGGELVVMQGTQTPKRPHFPTWVGRGREGRGAAGLDLGACRFFFFFLNQRVDGAEKGIIMDPCPAQCGAPGRGTPAKERDSGYIRHHR